MVAIYLILPSNHSFTDIKRKKTNKFSDISFYNYFQILDLFYIGHKEPTRVYARQSLEGKNSKDDGKRVDLSDGEKGKCQKG